MVEKVLTLHKEKIVFWTLIGTIFLFAGFYVYFVRTTINNVVVRQNLESEASSLSVTIGTQEFEYITKRNSITMALAYSMGFKDSHNKIFVSKDSTSEVAYLNN